MNMVASIRTRNAAPKAFAAAMLATTAVGLAMADEPLWPADFDSNVSAHIAATVPSGVQSGTAAHVQPVSVVPSVAKASNGGNVSSWPTGGVVSFR